MILVDTSVWIDRLRQGEPRLVENLNAGQVRVQIFVIGEWVLGRVRQRDVVLSALRDLPRAAVAPDDEMFAFIERDRLSGLGIGFVDAHLLAAIRLMHGSAPVVTEQKARCGGGPTRAGHGTDEGMTTEGTHNRDLPTLGAWGAFDRPGPPPHETVQGQDLTGQPIRAARRGGCSSIGRLSCAWMRSRVASASRITRLTSSVT